MKGLSSRRLVLASAVAALACTVTAGCTSNPESGPEEGSSSPAPSASTSASPEPVTIRFAVYGGSDEVAAYTDLADAFMKNNPHATVVLESAATAEASMGRLRSQFAAQNAPDVFLVEHDELAGLVRDERVQPVDLLLEEREVEFGDGFHRDGLEAFSAEAALQCMPNDVSPDVVYYNKDLLDFTRLVEPGEDPPTAEDGWTWDQFALAARQMSRGQVNGVYIEPALESLAPFIWSAGGALVDDPEAPTTLTMAGGETQEAVQQVLGLVRDPGVAPTQAELAKQSAVTRFETGRLGMIIGTRGLTPQFREAPGLEFDVFPLPEIGRFRTISSMNGYCISAETDKVEAAADFLAFAVGREGATITTTAGYTVPSNVQVASSPAFNQPGRLPENNFVFTEGVRRTDRTPFVPEWSRIVEATDPFLERLFYAPVIDVDALLGGMDLRSQTIFAPDPAESS